MNKIWTTLLVLMFFIPILYSDTLKIKYFQIDNRYEYRIKLLELVLEKTEKTHGDFLLQPIENITQGRGIIVYFFVNKKNVKLASRLERGLNITLKDGSFKKLFFHYHEPFIKQANLDKRKLFILKNPNLPEGTPDPDTSWWLK